MHPAERTIQLPALSIRASMTTASEANREVDVCFATGYPVTRSDNDGGQFDEVLSFAKGHVRLDRLNSGAPLLGAHRQDSLNDVLGVVVEGSARVDPATGGRARVRFSRRPAVEPIFRDVVDGIVKNCSIGYRVFKYQESKPSGSGSSRPVWTAIDWEIFEISLVPIPADPNAGVGRAADAIVERCVVVPFDAVVAEERAAFIKEITFDERAKVLREYYDYSDEQIDELRPEWERHWHRVA